MFHVPATLDQQIDRAAERNAALAVRLRHVIAKLHLMASDHPRTPSWTTCSHPDCRSVVVLMHDGRAERQAS